MQSTGCKAVRMSMCSRWYLSCATCELVSATSRGNSDDKSLTNNLRVHIRMSKPVYAHTKIPSVVSGNKE